MKNNETVDINDEIFKIDMFEKIINIINTSGHSTREICETCDLDHDELILFLNGTNLNIMILKHLMNHLGYTLIIDFEKI